MTGGIHIVPKRYRVEEGAEIPSSTKQTLLRGLAERNVQLKGGNRIHLDRYTTAHGIMIIQTWSPLGMGSDYCFLYQNTCDLAEIIFHKMFLLLYLLILHGEFTFETHYNKNPSFA